MSVAFSVGDERGSFLFYLRRDRVGRGLGEEHQMGQRQHLPRHRPPFPLVGVEEPGKATAGVRRPVVGGRAHQLDAALHRDPALPERGGQDLLDVHLLQQRQVRERGVVQRHLGEPRGHSPAPEVQLGPGGAVAAVEQPVGHDERAEALQGPWVHDHRPGRAGRLRPALHDADRRPVVVGRSGPPATSRPPRATMPRPRSAHPGRARRGRPAPRRVVLRETRGSRSTPSR